MKNSWIIAMRELRERLGTRSFVLSAFLGPIILLGLTYVLFVFGGKTAVKWEVLIADPGELYENKLMPRPDSNLRYSFINCVVEVEEFANAKKYQKYDALVEINEKVLSNKTGFVFYREQPAPFLQKKLEFQVERRMEEVLVERFTDLSLIDFRKIKQPLNLSFRNAYDPYDESSDKRGWVGVFFGAVIFVFIALFAMTVLRGVTKDKSNRVVEVMLASVKPNQLMLGKISGIGLAALAQFAIWIAIIAIGLLWMRQSLFPGYVEANLQAVEAGAELDSFDQDVYEYNEFVDLVYERIYFGPMILGFAVFFIGGYFFYAAFSAGLGASMGSESDGQQFVIPLILLMCFGVYAGYYALQNPTAELTFWLQFIPFTAPAVGMVKLALGYADGTSYQFYLAIILLYLSALLMTRLAGRLYKNGLLHFGHRLNVVTLLRWLKKS